METVVTMATSGATGDSGEGSDEGGFKLSGSKHAINNRQRRANRRRQRQQSASQTEPQADPEGAKRLRPADDR
eukprot:1188638-Prorocentrum_minimum.AAC.4